MNVSQLRAELQLAAIHQCGWSGPGTGAASPWMHVGMSLGRRGKPDDIEEGPVIIGE